MSEPYVVIWTPHQYLSFQVDVWAFTSMSEPYVVVDVWDSYIYIWTSNILQTACHMCTWYMYVHAYVCVLVGVCGCVVCVHTPHMHTLHHTCAHTSHMHVHTHHTHACKHPHTHVHCISTKCVMNSCLSLSIHRPKSDTCKTFPEYSNCLRRWCISKATTAVWSTSAPVQGQASLLATSQHCLGHHQ